MKNLICSALLILFISACQNQEGKTPASILSSENEEMSTEKVIGLPYNAEYNEKTQKLELKHNTAIDASRLTTREMIEALNLKYPDIKLQMVKTLNHTVHVKINDANTLTESMGSAGSEAYMAEATFALTAIAGINAVDFSFKEGSHASPGVYSRADFKGFN